MPADPHFLEVYIKSSIVVLIRTLELLHHQACNIQFNAIVSEVTEMVDVHELHQVDVPRVRSEK
jgi:hypothetical protein